MFLRAERQPRKVLRWGTWFRKREVGFEGEAKGCLFLASKLELWGGWQLGSLRGPLSQIPPQRVAAVLVAAAAVVVVAHDVGFSEWFGCFGIGFGFWVCLYSNPLVGMRRG